MPDGAKNIVAGGSGYMSSGPPSVKATADNRFAPFFLSYLCRRHTTASMEPTQVTVTVCLLGAGRRGTALLHSSSNPLSCGSRWSYRPENHRHCVRGAPGRLRLKTIVIVSEVLLAASLKINLSRSTERSRSGVGAVTIGAGAELERSNSKI
ncbi:hypothetical protein UY3_07549 [Chelonia mydas]|uniref:Uncharacterized protein n=1 Tax=Chelonia mydas TaxID=8469 RepID=M7C4C3_CHEMY|nr:hypothetical protein UY3_07549 [Chelonia mydas]